MLKWWRGLYMLGIAVRLATTVDYSNRPCDQLHMGQFVCEEKSVANSSRYKGPCEPLDKEGKNYGIRMSCYPAPETRCNGREFDGETVGFSKTVPCNRRGDKSFVTALLLSIFLGMFGVDRFYLGYPALGLLKLGTFGFMLVGQLIDIILIATQVVKPADGSDYLVDYFGAQLAPTSENVSFPVR